MSGRRELGEGPDAFDDLTRIEVSARSRFRIWELRCDLGVLAGQLLAEVYEEGLAVKDG